VRQNDSGTTVDGAGVGMEHVAHGRPKREQPQFSVEEVLAAVEKGDTQKGTARVLRCSRETVRRYAQRSTIIHDALEEKRGELIDLAEMGLRAAVLNQEPWAVMFTLRTLGRNIAVKGAHPGAAGKAIRIKYIISPVGCALPGGSDRQVKPMDNGSTETSQGRGPACVAAVGNPVVER
jgi:hypothetical protein